MITATSIRNLATEGLIEFLGETRPGADPIAFTVRRRLKPHKKHRDTKEPCPYVDVFKVTRVKGMVQCDYGNAMVRRTGCPAPYTYKKVWHEPVLDHKGRLTPCSRDKNDPDKFYLRVQDPTDIEVTYTADGMPIDFEALAPYLPKEKEEPVVGFKVYTLDKIEEVTVDKKVWVRPAFIFESPDEETNS